MAISPVSISDFVGFWKINADTYQKVYLQDNINPEQERLLRFMISVDAYNEINANGIASKPKWNDLFNGSDGYLNEECDRKMYHLGITDSLKGLLYFVYVRDRMFDPTNSGNVEPKQEVSGRTNNVHNGMIAGTRWNNAFSKLCQEILPFIENYEEVSRKIDSSIDLGTGNYTINISDTIYLSNGESVTIQGIDYVVSNVVQNVSFDISGAVIGKDFTGLSALWKPYEDFPLRMQLASGHLQPVSI